ncbi:hypothetical protein D3C80_1574930 [compost metagenome]
MDDPLGLHALPAAQAITLHQKGGVAEPAQAGIQPEAGDTAADDEDIGAQGLRHERLPFGNKGQSITPSAAAVPHRKPPRAHDPCGLVDLWTCGRRDLAAMQATGLP